MSEIAEKTRIDRKNDAAAEAPAAEANRVPQPQPIEADDSQVIACYTNFCRVTGTPEELIVDFGFNTQPFGQPTQPIKLTQRSVMNFYTAKRLLAALHLSVQRHEAAFGVLETDVQKRVQPQPR